MIGRILDFFYDKQSPFNESYRVMDDIEYNEEPRPEIGLPINYEKKNMTYFETILARRQEKHLLEAPPNNTYLFETLAQCILSSSVKGKSTPYSQDDFQWEIQQDESDLLVPAPRFLKKLLEDCKKKRSSKLISRAFCHLCWKNKENYDKVEDAIIKGITDNDYEETKPFLRLMRHIFEMEDDLQTSRIDRLNTEFT